MTVHFDIFLLLGVVALGVNLFFVSYFLFYTPKRSLATQLVLCILTITLVENLGHILIHSRLIYVLPKYFGWPGHFKLLLYPLLLLYVGLINGRHPFTRAHLILFLPFLIEFITWLPQRIAWTSTFTESAIDAFYADNRPGPTYRWSTLWLFFFRFFIPVVFSVLLLIQVRQLRHLHNKSIPIRLLSWLAILALFYALFADLINIVLYEYLGESFSEWPSEIIILSASTFVIGFHLITQTSGKPHDSESAKGSYLTSSLSRQEAEEIFIIFNKCVLAEQLFLDPGCSLQGVATRIGTNPRYLSQAINSISGSGFTEHINKFRIDHAIHLLRGEHAVIYTIEAIGQLSGFRSKSVFYRAFEQHTGTSPAKFRQDTH